MDIQLSFLVVIALASFRITHLIVFDKIMNWFRNYFLLEKIEITQNNEEVTTKVPKGIGIRRFIGELISCYWCVGVWISAFLIIIYYLIPKFATIIIFIFAVAALGSIIEAFVQLVLKSTPP